MKAQRHDPQNPVSKRKSRYLLLAFFLAAGLILSRRAVLTRGASGPRDSPAANPPVTAAGRTAEQKLIHANRILGEFQKGQERVKVIVNLIEPTTSLAEPASEHGLKAEAVHRYHDRLNRRHAEVQALQTPALAALSGQEFQLWHQYSNWASFAGEVTRDGLNKLAADPLVESIEFDYPMKRLTKQGIPLMNASEARTTYNGQGVAIAILDDGIDYRHPQLGGGGFPNSKVIGGYDVADHDTNPAPDYATLADCAHGTNCAGIAAGDATDEGDYIGGIACGAKLYAVKVFSHRRGSIYDSDVIAAWDWCINHKSDDPAHPLLVISVSLGQDVTEVNPGDYTASSRKATDVVRAGITLVASAGNNGWCDTLEWPACLRDVISASGVYDGDLGTVTWVVDAASCAPKYWKNEWCVDDTTALDKVAAYSNVAPALDLFAPCNDTCTTDVMGAPGEDPGNYVSGFGGTSASSPYVAGAVACLQSAAQAHLGYYFSPAQVRDLLARTGDLVTDTKTPITKPRVNLGRAVEEVLSGRATTVVPIYRFWSPLHSRHFYTIDEAERNKLLDSYSSVWTYEGIVYHAVSLAGELNAMPVHRFWSPTLNAHFYTISAGERDKLISQYSNVWTYEGAVFCAFPAGQQPADTYPVYRFWSDTLNCHFYTITEAEKDKLIAQYAHTWTYEGIVWYGYK